MYISWKIHSQNFEHYQAMSKVGIMALFEIVATHGQLGFSIPF